MKIVISVSMMFLMLGACGEIEQDDPAIDSHESAVFQCGFGCVAGSHPASYGCSASCSGACSSLYNQTDCQPNTGASFNSCGLGCPKATTGTPPSPGYHATAYQYTLQCRASNSSSFTNNTTSCALNTGSSFFTCGLPFDPRSCPTGYHIAATGYSPSCRVSATGGVSDNQVLCSL